MFEYVPSDEHFVGSVMGIALSKLSLTACANPALNQKNVRKIINLKLIFLIILITNLQKSPEKISEDFNL
jgi:hypothetical protein